MDVFNGDEGRNALNLIQRLLTVSPSKRLGAWSLDDLLTHSFFESVTSSGNYVSVDWEKVNSGTSSPPDSFFNRNLGYLDIYDRYSLRDPLRVQHDNDCTKEDLTQEQQDLFSGY
jgi:hypothetical protein